MEYGLCIGELADRIKRIFSDSRYIKIIFALGICGIILIFISGISDNKSYVKSENSSLSENGYNMDEYAERMEKRLSEILQKIDGVGRTEVMVTVECTEEYIYAEEMKSDISESDDKNSIHNENKYVFKGNNSEKEALLKKIVSPKISGVVIVCEGGDKSKVAENIYNTVSVALDIPSNKIYVAGIR